MIFGKCQDLYSKNEEIVLGFSINILNCFNVGIFEVLVAPQLCTACLDNIFKVLHLASLALKVKSHG